MSAKQLISIHVDDTDMGTKWTLNILGRVVNSGYARDQWAALDAANEELATQFFSPLGRYYQAKKGSIPYAGPGEQYMANTDEIQEREQSR